MVDIVNAFQQYQQRTVISGKLVQGNRKLHEGVRVIKIVTYNRTSAFKRLFTWAWGFCEIVWIIKTRFKKADLFIVTNPPFAVFLPLFCRNKYSILVFDVYPDVLIAYNYFGKQSLWARWWSKANRKIFSNAKQVFTISEGMKKLLEQYVQPDKITVVPLWAQQASLQPIQRGQNMFIHTHGLQDKFVVLYSGNLGHSHNVEVIIDIARLANDPESCLVIIGEGDKKEWISRQVKDYGLKNCLVLPWQPVDMLPYSLSAADVAIVTLSKEASAMSIPSKTFNLLAAGIPLLCIAAPQSDLAQLVARYNAGQCFEPDAVQDMLRYIKKIKEDKNYHQQLKENALRASKDFSPDNALVFAGN